jgi:hypothetical protein
MVTLAEPSRSFWSWKEQSLKLNTEQLFLLSRGKIYSFLLGSLPAQPSSILNCFTHEDVLLSAVAMDVTVEDEIPLLLHLLDELLGVVDGRMQLLGRVDPLPVQIHPSQVATVVTVDDSVDVEHGNDLEDEIFPQDPGLLRVASQEVDHVLHDVAGHRFSWVHS